MGLQHFNSIIFSWFEWSTCKVSFWLDQNTYTPYTTYSNLTFRFLGLKNFIFWCHIGQGKGQLTYGSVMDLLDQNFYNKKVIEAEDEKNEEWFLSFLDGSVLGKNDFSLILEKKWTVFSTFFCTFLVFSKAGKIEMKIFGLQYDDLQDDLSDDAQSLLWEF